MQPFDLVIRGGTVANATDTMQADVGIRGETIAAIGQGLDKGKREIDARGKLVLPGGVDSHCHIEQLSASACVSTPNGPSASVEQTISGPSAKRSGATAASIAAVTASFELGLTTRMRGRFSGIRFHLPARLSSWITL